MTGTILAAGTLFAGPSIKVQEQYLIHTTPIVGATLIQGPHTRGQIVGSGSVG